MKIYIITDRCRTQDDNHTICSSISRADEIVTKAQTAQRRAKAAWAKRKDGTIHNMPVRRSYSIQEIILTENGSKYTIAQAMCLLNPNAAIDEEWRLRHKYIQSQKYARHESCHTPMKTRTIKMVGATVHKVC